MGLVFGINLLAEDKLVPGIDHHRQIVRLADLRKIHQPLREDVGRLRRLAGRARQIPKWGEIGPENLGMAIDDVKSSGFRHVCSGNGRRIDREGPRAETTSDSKIFSLE